MHRPTSVVLVLTLAGCAPPPTSVADVAVGNADFTELVRSVIRLGLVPTLDDREARLTVFAPTDAAFEGVDTAALSDELLATVVTHHVVGGQVLAAADLPPLLPSLAVNSWDHPLALLTDRTDGLAVCGAPVILPDVQADNGVIHAIDQLLLPADALGTTGLLGATRFVGLLEELSVTLGESALLDLLSGPGPITLFLPTDAAFEAAADALAALDTAGLTRVLAHHLVAAPEPVLVGDGGAQLTLAASSLTIDAAAGTVDGALVLQPDVHVTNGVIHLVDRVLLPPPATP
ncbi:MAG: fasciclin domain-containing protein [Alphaproteobacteria bacterium]|nr:fasciclin domain-containing protein [Alphaproteobacteria bacterium]